MQGNSLFTTFNGKYLNISDSQQHKNIHKIRQKKAELSTLQKSFFEQTGEKKLRTGIAIKKTILDIISLQLGHELEAWAQASATQGAIFAEMQNEVISMQQIKSAITGEKKAIIQVGEELRRTLTNESLPLEERAKTDLRFFDWKVMYSDVFEQGGFDIVIANPPYGYIFKKEDFLPQLLKKYIVAEYKVEAYSIFIERAIELLKKNGILNYITPYTYISGVYFSKLRQFLSKLDVKKMLLLGKKIFEAAEVDTSILFICNNKNEFVNDILLADLRETKIEQRFTHHVKMPMKRLLICA